MRIVSENNGQLTKSNAALNTRIEDLTQKLIGQCESEAEMSENYQQEIRAQTKLAELYKGELICLLKLWNCATNTNFEM